MTFIANLKHISEAASLYYLILNSATNSALTVPLSRFTSRAGGGLII